MNIDVDLYGKRKPSINLRSGGGTMPRRPEEERRLQDRISDCMARLNTVNANYQSTKKELEDSQSEIERVKAANKELMAELARVRAESEKLKAKAQKPWKSKRHEVKREEPVADENVATEEV